WVEFGGYYWRIVRVNGDGSIRLIYHGNDKDVSESIEESIFNEGVSYYNNSYAGYWYKENEAHGLEKSSTAYNIINDWFASSNIRQGSEYFDKIDLNAGFCGDRTAYSDAEGKNKGGGVGTETTYYGAYVRNFNILSPSYNCEYIEDLYTYKDGIKGNKVLENPVGMLSADEAIYAGLTINSRSSNNYLIRSFEYWLLSPMKYGGFWVVFVLYPNGTVTNTYMAQKRGFVPVINLRSDVEFTGDGTISNPFKVVIS
ncbi:MAG: hypothetical protein NC483_04055, partial [Ruminococcus sp.]|nr:hypothetical protein [Ruminococcus sp.]